MVPCGSLHRWKVFSPHPPRSRGRQRGNATATGNGHEGERTGWETKEVRRQTRGKTGASMQPRQVPRRRGLGWTWRDCIARVLAGGSAGRTPMWLGPCGDHIECRVWWWRDGVRKLGRRFSY